MTTLQLAQRVLSSTALPQDPTSITADLASVVVGAMNSGVSRYHLNAPSGRKVTPVTAYIKPPRSYSSVSLTQGSYDFTGIPDLAPDDLGDTLRIGDRSHPLALGSKLRDPWAGQTGIYNAVLFDDVVPIYAPVRRIEGSVIYDERYRLSYLSSLPLEEDEVLIPRRSNIPQYYTIEHLGDVVGGPVRAFVRVYPFPTQPATIRFSASLEPQQFSIQSISTPSDVYIGGFDIEAFVIPLILAELAQTQVWSPALDRGMAITKGKEIEAYLRTYHEPTGSNISKVLTPAGY
jgi:hypothetical protein